MSQLPELIIFDWNGTIINDVAASAAAMQGVLDKLGDERTASVELYRQHCSIPIRKTYESLGYSHLSTEEIIEINAVWQDLYKQVEHEQMLQPGIAEAMEWIEANNIPKVILSNHMKPSIELNTQRLGLNFDEILARVERHHMISIGKQQLLIDYIERSNIDPEKTIIIGDTMEEYEIAKNTHIEPIIITNGSIAKERLAHIPAQHKITSSQLGKKLQDYARETI